MREVLGKRSILHRSPSSDLPNDQQQQPLADLEMEGMGCERAPGSFERVINLTTYHG